MGLFKSIGKIVKKVASPVASMLMPGSGEILKAGLNTLSTIKKGDEAKQQYREQARINAANRGDAFSELQRMIDENKWINDDLVSQRTAYNDDVRSQRDIARNDITALLDEIRNTDTNVQDVAEIGRDKSLDAVMRDRAAVRARQNDDANEATVSQRAMQTELGQAGPSADVLASMISRAGGRAITKSFEDSGNKAAIELSRTGGSGASTFAKLARERADALAGNDINAQLAGLQGAEDLAGAKASRLSPLIAQMSARRTAQQDGSVEGAAGQMDQSRQAQNRANLLDTMRLRGSLKTAKMGNMAGMAPAILAPSSMRLAGPQALQKSGGLNMGYSQVGQSTLQPIQDNTTSNLLEGAGALAGMISKKAPASLGAGYKPATVTTPGKIGVKGLRQLYEARG